MDFNKERFLNFGKFDFTINKAFYYTMSLATIFGAVGITIICFMFTCMDYGHHYPLDGDRYFENREGTILLLSIFLSIMLCIFAGFTFHNLRNKQGRITELTLPASNLEKFSWHLCVPSLGGLAVCFLAFLCADLVNAVLTLFTYPEGLHSITLEMLKILLFDTKQPDFTVLTSYVLLIFTCYVLGNSIKYKYNIVITYIILQILFVFSIFFSIRPFDSYGVRNTTMIVEIVIHTILTVLCLWGSYKYYTKAQITSRWNK